MAKAINWPKGLESVILSEDTQQVYCAIRPGRLYYDNHYWVDGEVVDIRVDQQPVRKGVVVGELKCCAIERLLLSDVKAYKPALSDIGTIRQSLEERYGITLSLSDEVTVVYYRNL